MRNVYIIALIFFCIITFLFFYYKNNNQQLLHEKKLSIVCTTGMITDAVKKIGKNHVNVHGLMGPGVDPHLYRARASDMQKLSDADVIFYNGLHLEGKMIEVFESLSSYKIIIAVSDALEKKELRTAGFDNVYDPHIWHDVLLWIKVVKYITQTLQKQDPQHAHEYEKNANIYITKLEQLHKNTLDIITDIAKKNRILITAHDAFGYFGARYGVRVVGLQGVSTDADVGAKDIQRVVEIIIDNDVPAIFVESSIPVRTVQAVQDAVSARGKQVEIGDELFSDALGGDYANNYIGMIEQNVRALHDALKV